MGLRLKIEGNESISLSETSITKTPILQTCV